MIPEIEKQFQRLALKHLNACCDEAMDLFGENRAVVDTRAGAGLAAMVIMARTIAWSIGSSLASNGVPAEPTRAQLLREFAEQLDLGVTQPGEGRMIF